MPRKAKPKTREEKLQQRRAELDWQAQMDVAREALQAEQRKEHNAFAERVQAMHDAQDTFIKRSWAQRSDEPMSEAAMAQARREISEQLVEQMPPGTIPRLDGIYQAQARAEQAAAEEAERQRIAALDPHAVWLSTLPWHERLHVAKWEAINRQPIHITQPPSPHHTQPLLRNPCRST